MQRRFRAAFPLLGTSSLAFLLCACATNPGGADNASDPVEALAVRLIGSYSSAAQAAEDPEFRDIRLEMVRIWPARDDGPWLYAEQAATGSRERPYRQRVYRLQASTDPTRALGTIAGQVFELPGDPLFFAGAWSDAKRFDPLRPIDLIPREGCTLWLEEAPDGSWYGGSDATSCPSSLRGASYATSEVDIAGDTIRWWERGFDAEGRQVWGAMKGPYVFVKVK